MLFLIIAGTITGVLCQQEQQEIKNLKTISETMRYNGDRLLNFSPLNRAFEQKTYTAEKGVTFYRYVIKKDEITHLKTAITYYNNLPNTSDITYQEFTDLLDNNLRTFSEKKEDITKTNAFKFVQWGAEEQTSLIPRQVKKRW